MGKRSRLVLLICLVGAGSAAAAPPPRRAPVGPSGNAPPQAAARVRRPVPSPASRPAAWAMPLRGPAPEPEAAAGAAAARPGAGDPAPPAAPPPRVAADGGALAEAPAGAALRVEAGAHAAPISHLAASADGRYLATADRDGTIRLWGLPSGRPEGVLRLPGGPLRALAVAPEGQALFVSREGGADGGAALLRIDRRTGESQRREAGAGARALDVDRAGRLLIAGLDGTLWLQDAQGRPLGKAAVAATAVRFSPDGNQIAALAEDAVHILSAQDLGPVRRLAVEAPGPGATLGWSDGAPVIGAAVDGRPQLRRLAGERWQAPAAAPAASLLLPLPGRRLAFAAGAGWGLLTESGQLGHQQGPAGLDLGAGALQVDATGSRVRLPGSPSERTAPIFSVGEHTLSTSAFADSRFRGGRPAELGQGGASLRLASAEVALPAPARAAAYSGDGRLVVAALSDGTLRWYGAEDGRPLLSLFVHPDRKHWVAWTPSGFYDATPGGDELLGWEVRRGAQPADFFRVGLLRDVYYRPDVTGRVLFTLDEGRAAEEADAEAGRPPRRPKLQQLLPPVVTILDPMEGSLVRQSAVRVRVAVRSPSGADVTSVRALVRGRFVQQRALAGARGVGEHVLEVSVPAEDSTVAVIAETAGATSAPALLHLRWEGQSARKEVLTRDLHILAVGVSDYRQAGLTLGYPAKDATDVVAALREQQGKMYRTVEARLLTDKGATRAAVLEGLEWLRRRSSPGDVSLFFLAGHGINNPADGKYYFLPHDASVGEAETTMVAMTELRTALQTVAGAVLMFIDTCHSGTVMGPQPVRTATDLSRVTSELASVQSGVVVYMASTAGQTSRESTRWGNGAFTRAVVEGLRGKADYEQTGRITVTTLAHYISDRVQQLTHGEQTPTTAQPSTVPDFQIAKIWAPYPVQRKWWFWTAVGVVAAGVVGTALAIDRPWQPKPMEFDISFPTSALQTGAPR